MNLLHKFLQIGEEIDGDIQGRDVQLDPERFHQLPPKIAPKTNEVRETRDERVKKPRGGEKE